MKKLFTFITILLLGAAAIADRTPTELRVEHAAEFKTNKANIATWYKGVTESEWRGYADYCISIASTNMAKANSYIYGPNVMDAIVHSSNAAFTAEYDQKFADAGISGGFPWTYRKMPKMCEAWISNPSNAAEVAKANAIIAQCRSSGAFNYWSDELSVGEMANICSEAFRFVNIDIAKVSEKIVNRVSGDIKRRMRQAGMKIVSKDGTNPVQVEMDKLTAAFNAPRFAGLKEWFAKYYPEYTWIDSAWETDAEIESLKDAVFNGDVKFDNRVKNILRVNLGVVKYNEFVEAYNN